MKIVKISFMLLVLAPLVSAQNYNIDRHVIASGGGHSESANYGLNATVGQPAIGHSASNYYSMDAGFWPGGGGGQGSPCGDYVIGDYNGSSAFNVADIIAAFGKLKGQPNDPALLCECPPGSGNSWAVAMDVNSSCNFNIADIIWGFGKLRGQANDLTSCPDCPPSGGQPFPGNDGNKPFAEPRLKSKAKIDSRVNSE